MALPGPRSVLLFDLDGTLIDSAPDIRAALNETLAAEALPPISLEQTRRFIGDGMSRLVQRGFSAAGMPLHASALAHFVQRYIAHYEQRLAVETRPYPGVVHTLRALRDAGWRLGICTNKPSAATAKVLEALHLDSYFTAIGGGDSFAASKPDPGHVLGVLAALGAEPDDAVMIGDSENDVAAARGAALPVIVMSYGYARVPATELGADLTIDDFATLPQHLPPQPSAYA